MALSKHHRRLIRSPEFRSLHCRLGAPLPHPHNIFAYVVTASIKRNPEQEKPVSMYHGFHVAGDAASMRAIAGARYLYSRKYVNTCNGIVLLAGDKFSSPCRCIPWNPAVANVVEEV
ncbi:hypothetical protein PR202_ga19183 [Eleusine coracana subsp. coracana]|uniref:Uncharacterized protein n=1 Tax=Eleusine coracana subsp. coracana TaxID=191504 RepID=A0AAV5CUY5_ELECO|nr:hypothetical protein PR202_ga19183 [Eleusine coracana subsp. coracana]